MKRVLTISAISLAMLAPFAPAAVANDDDGEIRRNGSCSGSADWKLEAQRDDGALEVEWEVDSNRVGQVWRVRIFDNGDRVVATRRTTQAPSGSFEVERHITNRPGSDQLVARSRNLASGQVCRGTLTFG